MKTGYTYAVLRYVHDTTTGEFVNVGVLLYARDRRHLGARFRTTYGRLSTIFPGFERDSFRELIRFVGSRFGRIGEDISRDLPFEDLPTSVMEVATSVLPADDSSLQWAPPGSGMSENLDEALDSIYARFVGRYDRRPEYENRNDEEVWRAYRKPLEESRVLEHLRPKTITVQDDKVEFHHAWRNGLWHCLEPISFDLSSEDSIRDKAHRWLGQIQSISASPDAFKVYFLLGAPRSERLQPAFTQAVSILRKVSVENEIVGESSAEQFSRELATMIREHSKES